DTLPDDNETLPTIISGDLYRSIYETTPNTAGVLSVDKTDVSFVADKKIGEYGVFELFDNGHWIYVLDTYNPAVQDLNSQSVAIDSFDIVTSDNTVATIEVKIKGYDTVIEGDFKATIPEDFHQILNGTLYIHHSSATFIPVTLAGEFGTLMLDQNGSWRYKLNYLDQNVRLLSSTHNGFEGFNISTTDYTNKEIHIVIEGIDNGFITGDTRGSVDEINFEAIGELFVQNGVQEFIEMNKTTNFGTFILSNNGSWSYLLDISSPYLQDLGNDVVTQDIFTVSTIENLSTLLAISIHGINTPLELNASAFHALPTYIESPNNQNVEIPFPIVTASGDNPLVVYSFNGMEIEEGSLITLESEQLNTLEVYVYEKFGIEERNLSKTIVVGDSTPPLPPKLSYPPRTTLDQVDANITAFEDNVSIYINGVYIDTIIDSTQIQTVSLDTSGAFGEKIFNVTLKDQSGNESNATVATITTYNPDSPTDFSRVRVENFYQTYLSGGILVGDIIDTNGIEQVTVTYSDETPNEIYNPTGTKFTLPTYTYGSEHPFGTKYTISVIDNLGNTRSSSGTITEQNEPTQFNIAIYFYEEGRIDYSSYIIDDNGIQKIVISYYDADGTWIATDDLNESDYLYPDSTYYSFGEHASEFYPENTTFKIVVTDDLNNVETYNGIIEAPTAYPTNFSGVGYGENNDTTRYLTGHVEDLNGIYYVKIIYDDASLDERYPAYYGDTQVSLSSLLPHDQNVTFTIEVFDITGSMESYSKKFSDL
ncbi:MAG: VCBS domain-containing protein, partial [Campylobacterales bacterium]|nr:VCBS domain-containing protein [Campylobacterales bacterium]